jgi:hypothetical protein
MIQTLFAAWPVFLNRTRIRNAGHEAGRLSWMVPFYRVERSWWGKILPLIVQERSAKLR